MNNKLILSLSINLLFIFSCHADRVAIWPEGKIPDFQSHQIAATNKEVKAKGFNRAEHTMPYLDWFNPPKKKNGACMLFITGGGYNACVDGLWIDRLAKRFTELGYVCVNLTYRTPRPQGLPIYKSAWQDGQRAVRLVRKAAKDRGFNPEKIGALGFSAGSHLTVLLGTSSLTSAYQPIDELDKLSCHLNLAIPVYTAYALTDGLTGRNTRGGVLIHEPLFR